eukprot:GFUD01038829.1.p1 GENE.GFUD01038829.1~~GFUD01038829.1.p1  ORF type:complete len:101 (+),score=48.56 GFUD01038829.1:48-305(+)
MSLQEKISSFNKPDTNEEEVKEQQRKKASFNSKFAKFESNEIPKKESAAKEKARMFEDLEGKEEKEKESKFRKEQFSKNQEKFKE